jgi:hypothetical protein
MQRASYRKYRRTYTRAVPARKKTHTRTSHLLIALDRGYPIYLRQLKKIM